MPIMMVHLKKVFQIQKFAMVSMILLLLLGAATVRFYHLDSHGLWDSDAVTYSSIAKRWYFDHNFENKFAKPAYHLLSCAAIKIWGYYDFTLLYLNSFLDLMSILLIILIGRKIGIRFNFVFSAAVLYAFLPYILKENMRGLPHLTSTAFFLMTFYLFLIYRDSKTRNPWLLFGIGFLSIFTGNIHPTLLCVALFYLLWVIVSALKKTRSWPKSFTGFRDLWVYAAGGVFVYLSLSIILATKKIPFPQSILQIFKVIFKHRKLGTQGHQGNLFSQIQYTGESAADILTPAVVIFLSSIIAAFVANTFCRIIIGKGDSKNVWGRLPGEPKSGNICLLWGLVGWFLTVNFLTVKAWEYRLMIPSVPLIILGISYCADQVALRFPKLRLGILSVIIAGMISLYNVWQNKALIDKAPTVYREMANALSEKIDHHNRLLVSPSVLYQLCLEAVYFYGDYVYRVGQPWKPEFSKLQEYHIRYVVVAKDLNTAYPQNADEAFALQLEYALMHEGLKEMKAKLLFESDKVVIFEISRGLDFDISNEPAFGFTPPRDSIFYQLDHIIQPVSIKR